MFIKEGGGMKKQKAYTLVEILITIALIGIVVGIAVPSYTQHLLSTKTNEVYNYAETLTPSVTKCIQRQRALNAANYEACKNNVFNIPAAITTKQDNSVILCSSVNEGIIKVVASLDNNDANGEYAILLNPIIKNKKVQFIKTSSEADNKGTTVANIPLNCS